MSKRLRSETDSESIHQATKRIKANNTSGGDSVQINRPRGKPVSTASNVDRQSSPEIPDRQGRSRLQSFQRYRKLNEIINAAVEHGTRARNLTPEDTRNLPNRLASLGVAYFDRFQRLGDLNDLGKSIEYKTRALDSTPTNHRHYPDRLANLGGAYHVRFQRLGEMIDLEKAMEYKTRALNSTPTYYNNYPRRLASLGASYYVRFQRLGETSDVEKAIDYDTRALNSTPTDHWDFPRRLGSLGGAYYERFQRLGETSDLEKAIKYRARALDSTPTDHKDYPGRLGSLGTLYCARFQRLSETNDLEKAIEYSTRALHSTHTDHSLFPDRLGSLGGSYYERFQRLGETSDLEKAIKYRARALDSTPTDHKDYPRRLAKIGALYHRRFQCLGKLIDLEHAVQSLTRACDSLPDDHPSISFNHRHFAQIQFSRFQLTGDSSILQHSLSSFRLAARSSASAPRPKLEAALIWAGLASQHTLLNPLEAYQTAIDLLPQFIWLGATTAQRYQDLSLSKGLAVESASAAIRSSDYALALTWLEHTRCVVWNQSLMLRSPLEELQSYHPDLAMRLHATAKQLHDASIEDSVPPAHPSHSEASNPEHYGQHRRRLAIEYAGLLAQAQSLSGFENLLRPVSANKLIYVAQHGPVVILNCHKDHCAALLIIPGLNTVSHLPLPHCTDEKVQEARSALATSLMNKGIRERGFKIRQLTEKTDKMEGLLLMLWKTIVKPVLDFLGYINNDNTLSLPHITWCPTGAMTFLPFHAAGDYSQPRSRVFNYAISSYTPTLTALLSCGPSTLSHTSRVLAIGQAKTPGRSPLPGTTVELEHLRRHAHGQVDYSPLIDDQATTTTVLDAMEQHDWVHLACHAHQNVRDPTKSGFFLQDGTLDLASINRRSFKRKGLAFLSACQTATGDDKLPDEAIHLASGMLMAGYTSVIGTMWSVSDSDAPFVADKVYAQLMKERKVGNGEAGRALYDAIKALREEVGEKNFGRWVPYIHIGA